jgi:hypothetical protein
MFKNWLIVFPWRNYFSHLHTDENVCRGNFRIGRNFYQTVYNFPFLIIAKPTQVAIFTVQGICDILDKDITAISKNYVDGLVCAQEYLSKVTELVFIAHADMRNSVCDMRQPTCKCVCEKLVGNEKHEKLELNHYEWLNAHRNK